MTDSSLLTAQRDTNGHLEQWELNISAAQVGQRGPSLGMVMISYRRMLGVNSVHPVNQIT
jgi:hypothetical protein